MIMLYYGDGHNAAKLETLLISKFLKTTNCMNKAKGGERIIKDADARYFLYCAYKLC